METEASCCPDGCPIRVKRKADPNGWRIIDICRLGKLGGEGQGRYEPCEREPRKDNPRGRERRGEAMYLGGAPAEGEINTAAEPAAKGVESLPERVSDGDEGEPQRERSRSWQRTRR